ncbi:hypothetical protein LZ575_03005 [Antarcticibacterium sp. 1MA-6-2]|uniref:hypothetical protein n=1 Tax=Antarcticibacterium sp. 1MA-6-2 TaxID=2908210 RepID=UPI001F3BA2F3|nr:hypothetical protein [Antarcticibacterium sp. 1MA-6-2]UJH91671.1 hypothetical protein LZ575_03005 [Antarcticibacterium sp. 1MA-6-2]
MKITLYEFLALPDQGQYDVVFSSGDYLDIRIEESRRYVLYAVDRFFVEVEYDNDKNKIKGKRAFVQGELLDKYTGI